MQVATFVFAVLGWVTATAALMWNILSWLFTAGRARLEANPGAVMPGGQYMILTSKPDWREQLRKNLQRNQIVGDEAFLIKIRNRGRSPVSIERAGFESQGVEIGTIGRPDWGDKFPIRIEAGASNTMHSVQKT